MAFINAMNSPDIKKGVNGAEVYTEEGVGDYRVSLFTMLNRGLTSSYIQEYVGKIFNNKVSNEIRDLFVMAFQTRDIRGGKGEKKLFYDFINALYLYDNHTVIKMLHLVSEYGCWRDMWQIMIDIPELEQNIIDITDQVFTENLIHYYSNEINKISLLAKWLPREKSGTYPGLARKFANKFYAFEKSVRKRMSLYRKDVSMLNKSLKTVEINMCGKTWAEVVPENVPGRCLKIHKKAFLNETLKQTLYNTTLRYPDENDRMLCRQNFLDFIDELKSGKKKAHGANVVLPHELVVSSLHSSIEEQDITQGQWASIRDETLKLDGLGKCVPMCDFSGSMNGLPKLISLALGILISEINHDVFKDHILTFDAAPKWHSFTGLKTLKEKLDSISSDLGHGLNTDFYKACMCILDKMKQHKVPVGEEPEDLIVLTDMGFDTASQNHAVYDVQYNIKWETQIEQIRGEFKRVGEELWGEGNSWKVPNIVIWNLSAQFKDFHAKADQDGVVQLSGWSPSILKALQKDGVKVMTPYQGMRVIIDDERYDPVRKVWDECHI